MSSAVRVQAPNRAASGELTIVDFCCPILEPRTNIRNTGQMTRRRIFHLFNHCTSFLTKNYQKVFPLPIIQCFGGYFAFSFIFWYFSFPFFEIHPRLGKTEQYHPGSTAVFTWPHLLPKHLSAHRAKTGGILKETRRGLFSPEAYYRFFGLRAPVAETDTSCSHESSNPVVESRANRWVLSPLMKRL